MDDKHQENLLTQFPRSNVWDETTQQIVDSVRAYLHRRPQPTISKIQRDGVKARKLGDDFHVVQTRHPSPPQDDARALFFRAFDKLGKLEHPTPQYAEVGLEWIAHKNKSSASSPNPRLSARDSLASLSASTKRNLTMIHVHGGGMFHGSPGYYRLNTSQLASLTGGRVVSLEYRLCPQHMFPTGLFDVFISYLSLFFPPSDSPFEPIDPSTAVLVGDSSGAQFAFGLLQIISAAKLDQPISFHSHRITSIPFPAGIAAMSLSGDCSQSMPSYATNRVHDLYLNVPWAYPDYPRCELWPTKPPRVTLFSEDVLNFTHPLLSLCLAKSWKGCPPMFFSSGDEQYMDGAKAVARRASQQGVHVEWLGFEAMPHCFPNIPGLSSSPQSSMMIREWATFCVRCIEDPVLRNTKSKAYKIGFGDLKREEAELESLNDPSFEEIELHVKARLLEMQREFLRDWKSNSDRTSKL